MDFMPFFETVVNAGFGFEEIIAGIIAFYAAFMADVNVLAIWDVMWVYIEVVMSYVPFILIGLCLVVLFLGKRLFSLLRFLSFFVVGFALGVYFLSPIILPFIPDLPTWVIGIVVGLLAAVLSKLLYFVLLIVVAGYSMYIVIFRGMILPEIMTFATGNMWVSLAFAVGVIVILLLLRKFVEMLGTSLLGAWGIVEGVRMLWDFAYVLFPGFEWLAVLVATAVIGIIGFIVQFKTRVRY